MRQKIFALFDEFEVYDEFKKPLYHIKNYGLFSHHFEVTRLSDGKVYEIDESVFKIFNEFRISSAGNYIDTAKQQFRFFGTEIKLNEYKWTLSSNILSYKYLCNDAFSNEVFSVRQQIISFTDFYELDVIYEDNLDFAVILLVCIDALECRR